MSRPARGESDGGASQSRPCYRDQALEMPYEASQYRIPRTGSKERGNRQECADAHLLEAQKRVEFLALQ